MAEPTEIELREMGLTPSIVSRGRSVRAEVYGTGKPDPDNPEHTIGTTLRLYQPGEVVWMPPDEAQRLRSLGYVLDPANADDAQVLATMFTPPPPQDGPTRLEMRKSWESQQLLFGRRNEVKTR